MRNPHHWPEEILEAVKAAEEVGWTWTVGNKNHIKLKHSFGGSVTVSTTPRNRRYIYQKIIADLKREGMKWHHPVIVKKS